MSDCNAKGCFGMFLYIKNIYTSSKFTKLGKYIRINGMFCNLFLVFSFVEWINPQCQRFFLVRDGRDTTCRVPTGGV